MTDTPNPEFLHDLCRIMGHDVTPPLDTCNRCRRTTMAAIKNASTKNFQLTFNEYDQTVQVTMNSYGGITLTKSEAKALGAILINMTDHD